MSNYTKSTNFATKDNLSPGDPLKIVRGTEIDTEFNNIATAIATKTDNSSAAITGGTIDGTTIGATTPSTGAFTTLSATGNVTLGDASTDTLNVGNGGLIKDSSGNLGLGVTPSSWDSTFVGFQLGASSTSNGNASIYSQKNGGFSAGLMTNAYYNGGWKYVASSNAATRYEQNTGSTEYFAWYTAPSGTAGNAITFTQAMTLDASGNLLVGTTSGSENLTVKASSGNCYISSNRASKSSGQVAFKLAGGTSGTDWIIYQDTNSDTLSFFGNSSTRMSLDTSGNLLIGQTTFGFTDDNSIAIGPKSADQSIIFNHYTGTTSGTGYAKFAYAGSQIGSITQNGTTAVAYNTSSDYRLKNTIAPMTGALAKVAQLKPVTYKWNADGSDGEGFIAHELAEVCPHAVTGEKDATEVQQYQISPAIAATYDEDGNELTPAVDAVMGERVVPKYQGIDTSFLVATLTAAIQELNAKFEAYKASHP